MSRHRHVWKIEARRVEESPFDQMAKLGITKASNLTPEAFHRDVIVTYRCEACGEQRVQRA